MLSSQPMNQRTAANGTTEVDIIVDAPATGKTRMVVAIRYINDDSVPHNAVIKDSAGWIKRVDGIPAGTSYEDWGVTVNTPLHFPEGEPLLGDQDEANATVAPRWRVDFYEGTD